jgi:hypothetical protein
MVCNHCGEIIGTAEESDAFKHQKCLHFHHECAFRMIAGSVGHIRKTCECFGGSEGDPPGMTTREAAKAAVAEWRKLNPPPENQSSA